MSLDVYLEIDHPVIQDAKIYVREDGSTRALTREEWDAKFPGREPIIIDEGESREVFSANITHNLVKMASEAGIYKCLWRPDENGIDIASQLIEPLQTGLALLEADPTRFKALNPENGWGDYDGLVRFVAEYLDACKEWPNAKVRVSR